MNKLTQQIRKMPSYYIYIIGAIFSIGFTWVIIPDSQKEVSNIPKSLDTYIPEGFVLVPIEVKNYESLDLVIGKFGVVDLYQSFGAKKKPKPIAKAIKILRSPMNPSMFAVLAPDNQAHIIVKHPGPFQVVVQNPKQVGTDFVKEKNKKSRRIIVGDSQ